MQSNYRNCHIRYLSYLLFLIYVVPGKAESAKYLSAERWQGEYLQSDEGALFIRIKPQGFQKSSRGRFLSGDIMIQVRNQSNRQSYRFSQSYQTSGQPKDIWKLPQGNYQIEQIDLIDHEGRNRKWQGLSKQSFLVKAQNLAHFGQWLIHPLGTKALKFSIKLAADDDFKNPYQHESFAYLFKAWDSKLIKTLGGEKVLKKSKDNFSSQTEARAAFTTTRQISMLYQLSLGSNRRYARAMISSLNSKDVELRECFSSAAELNDSLQGQVEYQFQINGQNGVMEQIKLSRSSLKEKKVERCLYNRLGQISFPISQNLSGKITFQFDIK